MRLSGDDRRSDESHTGTRTFLAAPRIVHFRHDTRQNRSPPASLPAILRSRAPPDTSQLGPALDPRCLALDPDVVSSYSHPAQLSTSINPALRHRALPPRSRTATHRRSSARVRRAAPSDIPFPPAAPDALSAACRPSACTAARRGGVKRYVVALHLLPLASSAVTISSISAAAGASAAAVHRALRPSTSCASRLAGSMSSSVTSMYSSVWPPAASLVLISPLVLVQQRDRCDQRQVLQVIAPRARLASGNVSSRA